MFSKHSKQLFIFNSYYPNGGNLSSVIHIFFYGSYLPINVPVLESRSYKINVSPLKYTTQ